MSIYQTPEYKRALSFNEETLDISPNFLALKKTISFLPIKKEILEARGTPSEEDLKAFKLASKNYFYGTIAPCVLNLNHEMFEKTGYKKISNYTILIDLKKTEEELWKNLEKKSSRWGVKIAQKNNLKFEIAQNKDIARFYQLYKQTAKEGNFKAESKEFLYGLANTEISKLFIIKDKKEILAGGLILIDKTNNYSILDLTASSEKGIKLQAMPFLYWNLILYSKSKNLNYFDLGGFDKEAKKGDKTYNINKFKERFGGNIVEQPIYSTNWKYPLLRNVLKNLKSLKNIYRKS